MTLCMHGSHTLKKQPTKLLYNSLYATIFNDDSILYTFGVTITNLELLGNINLCLCEKHLHQYNIMSCV
jgi:hypothetical protein